MLNKHVAQRPQKTTRLVADGGKWKRGFWRWGKREIIYLSLHCHHKNDPRIKMGGDESRFNASFIVKDKVTKQRPPTTAFLKRKESRSGIEPRPFCLPA